MLASEKGFQRLMEALKTLSAISNQQSAESRKQKAESDFNLNSWKEKCYDALNDDFNSRF
jgi:cysteinyl-tRNA synthetase